MESKNEAQERLSWHTEQRKVKTLVPYAQNPRSISYKQRKDLEASIMKFNLVELPAIDTNDIVVAGHQRLALLVMLGRGNEMIDVRVPNRALTSEEFREYNIRSNRQAGTFDTKILESMFNFTELIDWGFQTTELPKKMGPDGARSRNKNHKNGFAYRIQFTTEWQLKQFEDFVNNLKLNYKDENYISTRILKFIRERGV